MSKKIIAFAGSNSINGVNQQLIEAVSKLVTKVEIEIIDLKDYPAVIYSIPEETNNGFPKTMIDLKDKLAEANGYIISTPEHNGSMTAVLKNTIDWLSRQGRSVFNDNPTVFLSTSPGARGGISALNHLSSIMPYQGAKVIGSHAVGSFGEKVQDGVLVKEDDKNAITTLIHQLEDQI